MAASNPPQRVRSLAQEEMGSDRDGAITFEEACCQTESCTLEKLNTPVVVDKYAGDVGIQDLPLRDISGRASIKYVVDIITKVPAASFPKELIKTFMLAGNYDALPAPFGRKTALAYSCCMQLAVVPDSSDSNLLTVCKHFCFDEKVKPAIVQSFCYGTTYAIDYGRNFRSGLKGFQFMFERVGGYQIRCYCLRARGEKKIARTPDELRTSFIQLHQGQWATLLAGEPYA